MGRRSLLLIASILIAALGTALIWLYVQGAETRAQQNIQLVQALFLNAPQQSGAPADAVIQHVTAQGIPASAASPDLVTSANQVTGLYLKSEAVAGQILLRSMFTTIIPTGAQSGRGYVAITIQDPQRVPLQLAPGQNVAVYALTHGGPQLVVPSIKVVSVGPASTSQTQGTRGSVAATTVAFDADPTEALDLLKIQTSGDQPALYLLGPNTQAKKS